MRALKPLVMFLGVAFFGAAAFGAFREALRLTTRRETSEVIRLLSDREIIVFQIILSAIGMVSMAFAAFLLVRALHSRR